MDKRRIKIAMTMLKGPQGNQECLVQECSKENMTVEKVIFLFA